ncbi:hypothetical protein H072_4279 [Dactylellina haptotyla CBS 200.50]|uniref:Uncharacterized protein n=1 Tax=Dactylellina haptotyla (strain CBS 200.50) TaxID=1284197 RepID=S8AFE7_DACHA|nr:hypothetical protein H072_4279 [Dactylellina haptotyla CBS 200.50]
MTSKRNLESAWSDRDNIQYNGPFLLPKESPYNRNRETGFPIDVPFDPRRLDPEIAQSLNIMLSSTETIGLAKIKRMEKAKKSLDPAKMEEAADDSIKKHIVTTTEADKGVLENWFLPINGQEDNLAGLGGNWDYVKWNSMVVTCFYKQLQLGQKLARLARVHPPVELFSDFEPGRTGKLKKVSIMGKDEFVQAYGEMDVKGVPKKGFVDEDETDSPDTVKERKKPPGNDKLDNNDKKDDDEDDDDEDSDEDDESGDDDDEDNEEEEEDDDDDDYDDYEDNTIPDWRKLKPAPIGKQRTVNPLEYLYGKADFLPLDKEGKWVPPKKLPERDLTSLLDPDDSLYSILKVAADELMKLRKQKEEQLKKLKELRKLKQQEKAASVEKDPDYKPDGETAGGDKTDSRLANFKDATAALSAARPSSKKILKPRNGLRSRRYPRDDVWNKRQKKRRIQNHEKSCLRKIDAKFTRSGLRMASHSKPDAIKKKDRPSEGDLKGTLPWLKYRSGPRGPDFARRKWPLFKKDLHLKRWHLIPVACNVNDELRWWLVVIDMQVQNRPDLASKEKKVQHGRALWIYNPCHAVDLTKIPDGADSQTTFFEEVPEYIRRLVNSELFNSDQHKTPIKFPRSSDKDGLEKLKTGALSEHMYDHPGRFKHFITTPIVGQRYNYQNRNPHTGVDVIHAMGRILSMIEQEDVGAKPMASAMLASTLGCVPSDSSDADTGAGTEAEDLVQKEQDWESGVASFQNRVRTETMVEVRRFMNITHLRGYPFHRQRPGNVPRECYRMIGYLYDSHPETWRQLETWFAHGAHAAVVGLDYATCSKDGGCGDATPHVVSFPMSCGTYSVLHGRKKRHPFDDPKSEWWGNVEALDVLKDLPAEEQNAAKVGCLYKRHDYLRRDLESKGPIPVDGGPKDSENILIDEYPQSMISLTVRKNGQGIIHVGNRPNSIWKVNGIRVTQSAVIDRFSLITHLHGNGMHWIFLRRFAAVKTYEGNLQGTVPGDVELWRRPKGARELMMEEKVIRIHDPLRGTLGGSDMNIIFPPHTYLNDDFKNFVYDMGDNTPHFHHHHRPLDRVGTQEVEKLLWQSHLGDIFLCQNPVCWKYSRTYAGDKWTAAPNPTSIPCFDPKCVQGIPEARVAGTVTCFNVNKGSCFPDELGELGGHVPGIPGHMFMETGVLMFQPELVITHSQSVIDHRGANNYNELVSKDNPNFGKPQEGSLLPQPPLSWSRVAFVPVGRFPSVKAMREYLRVKFNYDPIIFSETETSGVAYDMTMYERLNYYRILLWNRLSPQIQQDYWEEHYLSLAVAGNCSRYFVSGDPETTLRVGYQQEQKSLASGYDGWEKTTGDKKNHKWIIQGAGDGWIWDLINGKLAPDELPWYNDQDQPIESLPYEMIGYVSAKHSLQEKGVIGDTLDPKGLRNQMGLQTAFFTGLFDRIRKRKPIISNCNPGLRQTSNESDTTATTVTSDKHSPESSDEHGGISPSKTFSGMRQITSSTRRNSTNLDDISLETHPATPPSTKAILAKARTTGSNPSLTSTPTSASSEISSGKTAAAIREILCIDGSVVTIGPNDRLHRQQFYTPYNGGILHEQCIQVFRAGLRDPILLRVKQTRIPNDKVGGVYKGNERENENNRGAKEEISIVESESESASKDFIEPLNSVKRTLLQRKSKSLAPESVEEELVQEQERSSKRVRTPLNQREKERELDDEDINAITDELANITPTTKRGRKLGAAKRMVEEISDSETPLPKKRGRKKKIALENQPYTKKDVERDLLEEDEAWEPIGKQGYRDKTRELEERGGEIEDGPKKRDRGRPRIPKMIQ